MLNSVGFIGTGNMGGAIAKAVAANGYQGTVLLADPSSEKSKIICQAFACASVSDNASIAAKCEMIFLAVKPQIMPQVLSALAPVLAARTDHFVLVTMAAGLSCKTIQTLAGDNYPVIRMMPNTPAAIGAGMIQYCGKDVGTQDLSDFVSLLSAAGSLDHLPEHLIDAASAVSGCGPAYVYMLIEALADGGVACGLPRDKALAYAAKMVEGAALMVQKSGSHPGALKDAVCSPAGSTIEGVRALEEAGFRAAAVDAVIAAYEKTLTMK